ncbi:MAG: hypothetical protein RR317_05785 [Bilophila sp.]
MATRTRTYQIWCLGLDSGDVDSIRACAGINHQIVVLPEDDLPSPEVIEREDPVLLWIGRDCWRRFLVLRAAEVLSSDPADLFPGANKDRFLEYIPQVLVLPENCEREDLELALDGGFQDVVRGALCANRIHEVLRRSLEVSNIHRDMDRMTREILLNRELLSRKSDVLSFLLHFMREITPDTDHTALLEEVRYSLSELLPVEAMHGAFWRQESDGFLQIELRLELPGDADMPLDAAPTSAEGTPAFAMQETLPETVDIRQAWTDVLLEAVGSLVPLSRYHVTQICSIPDTVPPCTAADFACADCCCEALPDSSRLMLLPLGSGEHAVGVLALLLSEACPLGRDQALALDAATRHLAGVLSGMTPQTTPFAPFSDRPALSQVAL